MCVHRDTGAQRAVKVLRKSHMDEDEKKMLFNEINILRGLVSTSKFRCSLFEHTSHYTPHTPLRFSSLFLFNYYYISYGPFALVSCLIKSSEEK
jgi:hypothetical protein